MQITNTASEKWAFRVDEVTEATVDTMNGITIATLMKKFNMPIIDILKMDIEGSEKEIFTADTGINDWLPKLKYLIIETHDAIARGSSRAVMKALVQYDFSFKHRGENLVFVNHEAISNAKQTQQ